MPDWEERISAGSHPALRLEHIVRYRAAAPIVAGSDMWCDLGCGTGIAAASAVGEFGGRLLLVDRDDGAIAAAASRFGRADVVTLLADLATEHARDDVRRRLESHSGCITCFEVIEHLDNFATLVDLLIELVHSGWTTVLSVPNDGFWSIENPYHATRWSESAVAELATLLPDSHTIMPQVALAGSRIGVSDERPSVDVAFTEQLVPTHFIAAFGPQHELLGRPVAVAAVDLDAQRTWERQREADLAYLKAVVDSQS